MLGAAEWSCWLCDCEPGWHCSTGQLDVALASSYQIGLLSSGMGSVAATDLYSAVENTPAQMSCDASSVVAAAGPTSALYRHLLAAVLLACRSGSDAAAEEVELASVVVGLMTQTAMVVVHVPIDAELSKGFLAPVVSGADSSAAQVAAAWGECMTAVADADGHTLLASLSGGLTGALVVCAGVGARQGGQLEADAVSRVGQAAAATLMHTPCC